MAGRDGWIEIGARIRASRTEHPLPWGKYGDRYVWCMEDDQREKGPVPLELEACHHRISAAMLEAIEDGKMDPRVIARTARWWLVS